MSKDAQGVGRSPKRQGDEMAAARQRRGGTLAKVYEDRVGASRHSRGTRHDFAELLADVADEARGWGVLRVWEISRAARDIAVYADLLDRCGDHGVRFAVGPDGEPQDVTNPTVRMSILIPAVVAEHESGQLRLRVLSGLAAQRREGRPHGKLPFGYVREYDARGNFLAQVPCPIQSPIVREIFDRVADGVPARRLAVELNARGIPTNGGRPWTPAALKKMTTSATYLGHRTHGGKVIIENVWPPLVDRITYDRCAARWALTAGQAPPSTTARHLLTGLFRCGVCGAKVHTSRRGTTPIYRCRDRACVARAASRLEEGVLLYVLTRLARPDAATLLVKRRKGVPAGARAELKALHARLDEAFEELADGSRSAAWFARLEERLTPRITELEALVARSSHGAEVADVHILAVPNAEDVWAAWSFDQRRRALRVILGDARLVPLPRGGKYDRLGLEFTWPNGRDCSL